MFILIYQEAVPIMAIAMADVIMEEDITALMDTVDAATNCYTLKSTIKLSKWWLKLFVENAL